MTDEHQALAADLLDRAICHTDNPARAVSVLLAAAATILQRQFGEAVALEIMPQALDASGGALCVTYAARALGVPSTRLAALLPGDKDRREAAAEIDRRGPSWVASPLFGVLVDDEPAAA